MITYATGTSNNMILVANKIPIPRDIAIGFRNRTCVLWLNSNGTIPKNVVIEVNTTGLNLVRTASSTAFLVSTPFSLALFTNTTKRRLSFTTTPDNAITPRRDSTDIGWLNNKCPRIAPTTPNGIADNTINGLKYDLSGIASST